MKIIKLDRRYGQYKKYGHTVAVKFKGWQAEVLQLESALRSLTGSAGIARDGEWHSYYGEKPYSYAVRPFFVTVRDEATLTMTLLKAQIQNE